ncbi:AMP-binding protein [Streptomyces sp. 3MP-14]|uniref:AMP-binding protein n=1 Tax=Streptomyces mimosae TaxID=2586635 RepID=A0A5N6A4N8_9ACTN|nr:MULTISPECIES: AMP-binding protein [Streptomyces]KAB8162876.1 AMP-binding protein [Streptomyces mimosae]KAB8179089.1 AMP-binding protein [Streptomyces sp. 3MP-14]
MAQHPLLALEDTAHPDPEEYLQAALRWHFSPETGSRLWLDLARQLDFDPVRDITGYADLGCFPDIAAQLRDRPVEDLIPAGLADEPVPAVFETGGTTGSPKRLPYTDRWVRRALEWKTAELRAAGFPEGEPWLVAMPSGPHAYGHTSRLQARALGSVLHTVDLDPRWVKKEIAAGRRPDAYLTHLVDQLGHVIRTQRIAALTTTPPILTELLLHDVLVDRLRASLRYLALAGAHLDDDTYDLIAGTLPDTVIQNVYGSTMVLTTARLRTPTAPPPAALYDGYPPFVVFAVVDPDTHQPVPYGQRGQVRMTHVSSGLFIPNNLERDSAIRVPAPEGGVGDALNAPRPLAAFDGEPVIQGVY